MRCIILGFVTGAAVLQTRATLPDHPGLMLLALVASFSASVATVPVIAARLQRSRLPPVARVAIRLLCGAALGYCWAAWLAQMALAPSLAPEVQGRDLIVTGTIASLPYRADGGVRFNFDVEKVSGGDVAGGSMLLPPRLPPRLALGWYSGNSQGAKSVIGDVQPGERWELLVRLQRPHGNANPDTFDYEVWLLEQGVRATGYVRPD
jgi:competence protein ComEC